MSWCTVEDVTNAIATVPTAPGDVAHLERCVNAANDWAIRQRVTAGYHDDPIVPPDAAVALGTTLYAVALWRERGALDSYPSFEDFATAAVPTASLGQIRRLLAVNRPQVDAPLIVYPAPHRL